MLHDLKRIHNISKDLACEKRQLPFSDNHVQNMLTPREKKVKKRTPAPRPHINVGKICKFQRMFFFFDASPTASQINVATLILGEGQGKYITLKRTFHKNQ